MHTQLTMFFDANDDVGILIEQRVNMLRHKKTEMGVTIVRGNC